MRNYWTVVLLTDGSDKEIGLYLSVRGPCVGLESVAPPGRKGGSFPLWVNVQKLCNMCVLSLSWNFFVSHDKYFARPSCKEPR